MQGREGLSSPGASSWPAKRYGGCCTGWQGRALRQFPRAATNRVASDNGNLFSLSSRGQKSEMKVLAGPCPLRRLWGSILPASPSCWCGLQSLQSQPPLSHGILPMWASLPSRGLLLCVCPDFPCLTRAQSLCRAHLNPASPHLYLIISAKTPFQMGTFTGPQG